MTAPYTHRRTWDEIEPGEILEDVLLPISYGIVAGHPAGTRDWFPGHHNPDYARSQGQENIYANTMFFQGFLERVAMEWAGPTWFVRSRNLRMFASVYPGDTLVGSATVLGKAHEGDLYTVELDVTGRTRSPNAVIQAKIQLATPARP